MQSIVWNGEKISADGMYSGMSLDDYHGDICVEPSISSTGLKLMVNQSPAHYFDASPYNPQPEIDADETEWQIIGRAAHHLLIGGIGTFAKEFIIRPQRIAGAAWQGNRTECRDWLKDQKAAGLTVLTQAQVEVVKGMALNLGRHPLIIAGLLDGQIEHSLFWLDQETGTWLKARPDALPRDSGDVADLKTTKSVLWPDLVRTLDTAGYYQQGALIADGIKAVLDIVMQEFVLVFVEKKRPYCVRIVPVHPDDIQRGRLLNRIAIRRFADCWAAGKWPGPGEDEFNHLRLSDAARERIDRRLEFEGMRAAA